MVVLAPLGYPLWLLGDASLPVTMYPYGIVGI